MIARRPWLGIDSADDRIKSDTPQQHHRRQPRHRRHHPPALHPLRRPPRRQRHPAHRRGYLGKTEDDTTGLLATDNRYYDPTLARFISVDPLTDLQNPQTLNPYSYAANNPTYSDPTGLAYEIYGAAGGGYGATPEALVEFTVVGPVRAAAGLVDSANRALGAHVPLPATEQVDRAARQLGLDPHSDLVHLGGISAPVPAGPFIKGLQLTGRLGGRFFPGLTAHIGGSTSRTDDVARAANTAARACSFSGGTLVLMADGSKKPIEDVEVGDKVQATDPENGEQVAKTVEHVFVHEDTLRDLVIDGELIATTEDHPFWSVTDQRFKRADELKAGEKVLAADGRVITVSGLKLGTAREALAYNISVEAIHTYHVGDNAVLVHNTCAVWALDDLSQSGGRDVGNGLTRAGQKLTQHGGQGNFPVPTGSRADINRLGQEQLDDLRTAPGTVTRGVTGGNFPGGRYYIAPDGRGALFDANGTFQYFGVFKP